MENVQLLGYRRFASKEGRLFCVATVSQEATPADNENGAYGLICEELFFPDHLYNFLKPEMIGKYFEPVYRVSRGKAYLEDFIMAADTKKK